MDEFQYVLTSDYAMKMLNINECKECKLPVIVCGETGVGKTFLIEIMSKIWNLSTIKKLRRSQISLITQLSETGKQAIYCNISLLHVNVIMQTKKYGKMLPINTILWPLLKRRKYYLFLTKSLSLIS